MCVYVSVLGGGTSTIATRLGCYKRHIQSLVETFVGFKIKFSSSVCRHLLEQRARETLKQQLDQVQHPSVL